MACSFLRHHRNLQPIRRLLGDRQRRDSIGNAAVAGANDRVANGRPMRVCSTVR